MAGKRRSDGGQSREPDSSDKKVPFSRLIPILRPDPEQPPTRVVLTGYAGPAKGDHSRFRLYQGLDFQSYYELSVHDVAAHWSTDPDDEHAPICIAIEATTKLQLTAGPLVGSAAEFLEGEIVFAHLPKAILSLSPTNQIIHCGNTCVATSCDVCDPLQKIAPPEKRIGASVIRK
jgi:hypothetical protein